MDMLAWGLALQITGIVSVFKCDSLWLSSTNNFYRYISSACKFTLFNSYQRFYIQKNTQEQHYTHLHTFPFMNILWFYFRILIEKSHETLRWWWEYSIWGRSNEFSVKVTPGVFEIHTAHDWINTFTVAQMSGDIKCFIKLWGSFRFLFSALRPLLRLNSEATCLFLNNYTQISGLYIPDWD